MLSNANSHTMIAAKDVNRAKSFYEDKLGIKSQQPIPGLYVFAGPNGGAFQIFASPFAGTAKNAVMGWAVANIADEVAQLKLRGVEFEEYDVPNFKTVDSIVTMPHGRSAWFKDSEGNVLGLVEWKR